MGILQNSFSEKFRKHLWYSNFLVKCKHFEIDENFVIYIAANSSALKSIKSKRQ